MPAPESSKAEPKEPEKPTSEAAKRAVVKPKTKSEPAEDSWKGGIDHFDERV